MEALVTGGAGFIGSHLAERLLDRGFDVTVLDNLSEGHIDFVPDSANFIRADIKIKEEMEDALREGFDRVYHLAANRDVRLQNQDRRTDLNENVIGTHNLLDAMVENDIDELVFTSSSTVYGEPDQFPTPESYGPLKPISLYGATKASAESLISAYCGSFGIDAVSLRLANIIGGRSDHGVTYDFVQKLKADSTRLEVLGNGNQRKSYLYVDDCIDAISKIDDDLSGFEALNVGNNDAVEVSRIAEIVVEEFGEDTEIVYEDKEKGWDGDVTEMLLEISRIEERGWEPSLSSAEAVRRTAQALI